MVNGIVTCYMILKVIVYSNFLVLDTLNLHHFSCVDTSNPNKLKYDCSIRIVDCFIRVFLLQNRVFASEYI